MNKIILIGGIVLVVLAGGIVAQNALTSQSVSTPQDVSAPQSKTLDLSGRGLSKIPQDVFGRTNLEELNVSRNSLTGAIQAEIRQLKNLRVLDVSYNKMTGVPAEIGQLQNLQVLDLSYNQLTGLPNELGNLKNLKTLNLKGNSYSEQDLSYIQSKLPSTVNIITK